MAALLGFLLAAVATFLILLVLVQRGRGGGLTGALGGMGGQSAFGAKAGDVFTKLTAGTALVWILLSVGAIKLVGGGGGDLLEEGLGGSRPTGVGNPAPGSEGATPGGAAGGPRRSSAPPASSGTPGGAAGGQGAGGAAGGEDAGGEGAGGEGGGSPAPSETDR